MDREKDTKLGTVQDSWEEHRRSQIRFIANNTTAQQRFEWLESMLEIFVDTMPRRDNQG